MRDWFKSGTPWIWLTAGAVAKGTLDAFGIYEGNPALRVGTREICD